MSDDTDKAVAEQSAQPDDSQAEDVEETPGTEAPISSAEPAQPGAEEPPAPMSSLSAAAEPDSDEAHAPAAPGTDRPDVKAGPADASPSASKGVDAAAASGAAPITAAPEATPPTEISPPEARTPEGPETTPPTEGGDLEEMTLPSSIQTLEPLANGTTTGPNGSVVVEQLDETRGRMNTYRAAFRGEAGREVPIELLEGPADHLELAREAEVLEGVRYAMLPHLYAAWEEDGRRYVAIDRISGPTLAEALDAGIPVDDLISIVLQLTQALRRLHGAGWVLFGLSPDGVVLGEPLRITGVGTALRIGEQPPYALQVQGYSAPELAHSAPITGKEDVYTLAALLYRGLAGTPLPEGGPELAALAIEIHTPGAPQLLAPALAPADQRIDLEGFYRGLLALKKRLTSAPTTVRVASGTSIGLNGTRVVNEDACAYLAWSSAWEGRVANNAVLCVVDGMGGMEAGEVASTAAIRAVMYETSTYAAEQIAGAQGSDRDPADPHLASPVLNPKNLVQAAAEATYTAARGRQVGATITCVAIDDGALTLGHVGDTRAYLLRDGVLTQLTRDHSLVAAMVASGMITKEEARGHPQSNQVLRSLGGQKRLPDDNIDGLAVAYGEEVLQLRPCDQILICSDGVWGQLDDDTLLRILTEAPDCESAVATAIQKVLEAGSPDNASIIVARCEGMTAS